MEYKITSYCEEDTIELAQNIESEKFPNMVICLEGDLGSGKTAGELGDKLKKGDIVNYSTHTQVY